MCSKGEGYKQIVPICYRTDAQNFTVVFIAFCKYFYAQLFNKHIITFLSHAYLIMNVKSTRCCLL